MHTCGVCSVVLLLAQAYFWRSGGHFVFKRGIPVYIFCISRGYLLVYRVGSNESFLKYSCQWIPSLFSLPQ